MSTTNDSHPGDRLQQRYGGPSRTSRLFAVVVGGLIVIALLAWVVWAIAGSANPAVSSQEVSKDEHGPHQAWITYQIKYGDTPVHATCTVRAVAADGEEVGRTSFHPSLSAKPQDTFKVTFRTTRLADSIEWLGCTAPGQVHPH
ncbi:MAG: DUF4307 domain-containing protein [Nocardioidaceae bacterium]|nr:DUF4307 domain-containing protein [Nocardioidaceae bacterium]MCL2612009.1 DUF4307 domain-containing protein [Nocardioidaceae bacterium]